MNWILVSMGFFTGYLVGLTGVGGGALISLLLLVIVGMPINAAVGTALLFAAITKSIAVQVFRGHALIDWTVVWIMWLGSLSASIATIIWIHTMAKIGQDVSFYKQLIASGILIAVMSLFLRPTIQTLSERHFVDGGVGITGLQILLTILAGATLGVLVTLTSVGIGALGLIILIQLYPQRMSPPRLVATNIAHAIPLALFGGVGHTFLGNVDLSALGLLLLGSMPGAIAGAITAVLLPHASLRNTLSATLWIFGLQLWWSVLPSSW
ncbi:hypothetical protein TI03_03580 [Achromatium sp. WMS1]|nr:hypothetical protein TI03_03580 [Achromatium sp. WMS1]